MSSPIFRISVGNTDITDTLKSRLLSLTVRDHAGNEADSFEMRLDDIEPRIPLPSPGDEVAVEMGYAETGLTHMGSFFLNELELSADPGWEMRVHGESADMLSALRTTRSQAWDDMTLGDIVSTCAARNGLNPVIDPELAGIYVEHIDQMNRSDMYFLTRLAVEYAAVFKVIEQQAVFAKRGAATSVTGQAIANVVITPLDDVLSWRVLHHSRGSHKELVGRWHDYDLAETTEERRPGIPGAEPDRTLPRRYPNMDDAGYAAASEARRLEAASGRLTLDLIGRADLAAEGFLTLAGFRDGIDGVWKILSVEHELTPSGFRTTVEGEIPADGAGGGGGGGADLPGTPGDGGGGTQGEGQ